MGTDTIAKWDKVGTDALGVKDLPPKLFIAGRKKTKEPAFNFGMKFV